MAFFSVVRSPPMAIPSPAPAPASSSRLRPFSRSSGHAAAAAAASALRVTSGKRSLTVRCEQSASQGGGGGGGGAGVWAGRAAMVSVTAAFAAELSTGKGLLENLGVATPAPALAFVVTALVVGLTVLFISQSGSGSRA